MGIAELSRPLERRSPLLSRVADSLYWMSRYFERADHCARVIEANYNLWLNPSKLSTEQRWHRVTACLGLVEDSCALDSHTALMRLTADSDQRSSIVSCVSLARENASQVREQISSEMWERINRLYHELTQWSREETDAHPLRFVTAVREGSFKFHGVTDATMNHGEGWHFIQLGKYMERACALAVLLDAHFSTSDAADDLDWVGLLASCAAFESYCRVYTADLKPDRVAEFLLLDPEFPYSVRYSVERMERALEAIKASSSRRTGDSERIIGRLRSSLAFARVDDIMKAGLRGYLDGIIEQCRAFHAALHKVYINYPIESAIEA